MLTRITTFIACGLLLLMTFGCTRRREQPARAAQPPSDSMATVRVSAPETDAAEPAVAAAGDGSVYVAWIEHRANKEADVFVAHLDGEGRSLGAPVRVNQHAGEAKGWRGDPPTIAVAPDHTVYVGWTGRVVAEGRAAGNLYLSASRDEGRTFGPPIKVNDDERPASHGMHSLAVNESGRVYLAWLDERNVTPPPPAVDQKAMEHMEANSEVFFAVSADGCRTVSKNVRLASEVCPCCKTALAVGAGEQVYVGWRQVLPGDFRHIAVAASSDGGRSFAPSKIISDDEWKITGCPVSGPALSVTGAGALRVAWYTAGERGSAGLYWSESVDGGQSFAPRVLLAAGQVNGNPHLLADAKHNLFAVWESDEKEPSILSAGLDSGDSPPTVMMLMKSAELPSTAVTNGQLFVGYIISDKERRSVWVMRTRAAA